MKINKIIAAAFNTQAQKEVPSSNLKPIEKKEEGDYKITFSTQEQRDLDKQMQQYKDIAKLGLCQKIKYIVEGNSCLETKVFQQQGKSQRY